MTDKELVERLRLNANCMMDEWEPTLCKRSEFITAADRIEHVPFPVSWTVKMKKKQKETQDILSYHTQAAGCSDKARAKASGGRQPIEECGRTGL